MLSSCSDKENAKKIFDTILEWRLGGDIDIINDFSRKYKMQQKEVISNLEYFSSIMDIIVYNYDNNIQNTVDNVKNYVKRKSCIEIDDKLSEIIISVAIDNVIHYFEKCMNHSPSPDRILYHDYTTKVQISTESIERISRPVCVITLRIQPKSYGNKLLPSLKNVSLELSRDMLDALASGFDRLQTQLVKIVQQR